MKYYIIEAKVSVSPMYLDPKSSAYNPQYPEKRIADMLRYDSGQVISKTVEGHIHRFIIKSLYYRKMRWDSFGIVTSLIRRE